MAHSIIGAPLLQTMAPTIKAMANARSPENNQAIKPKAGLFDQYLTQAEKEYLNLKLEQMQKAR